jgi:hypothetical protein
MVVLRRDKLQPESGIRDRGGGRNFERMIRGVDTISLGGERGGVGQERPLAT